MTKGPLLLAGSGEFTDMMTDVDRYWLRNIKNPAVAIIPTAAGQEHDWWKWATNGIAHYKKLGIPAVGVAIRTKDDAKNPSITADLTKANVYYFSGGDPTYVLSVMKNSPAWKTILSRFSQGAALAGSSAGAMMLGSYIPRDIRSALEQGAQTTWVKALGMVPYIIWPHFDWGLRSFGSKIEQLMEKGARKSRWLGIDENTGVIWENGQDAIVRGRGLAHWGKI